MRQHGSRVYTQGLVKRVLCLLAILAGATSHVIGQGLVLCVCTDGGVSVETSCNSDECCAEDIPAKGEFVAAFPHRTPSFGSENPCFCIPLPTVDDGHNRYYLASQTRGAAYPNAVIASARPWLESHWEADPVTTTRGAPCRLNSIPNMIVLLI
jgi:hypothetical protein